MIYTLLSPLPETHVHVAVDQCAGLGWSSISSFKASLVHFRMIVMLRAKGDMGHASRLNTE